MKKKRSVGMTLFGNEILEYASYDDEPLHLICLTFAKKLGSVKKAIELLFELYKKGLVSCVIYKNGAYKKITNLKCKNLLDNAKENKNYKKIVYWPKGESYYFKINPKGLRLLR